MRRLVVQREREWVERAGRMLALLTVVRMHCLSALVGQMDLGLVVFLQAWLQMGCWTVVAMVGQMLWMVGQTHPPWFHRLLMSAGQTLTRAD